MATFPILHSRIWLVAAILDGADLWMSVGQGRSRAAPSTEQEISKCWMKTLLQYLPLQTRSDLSLSSDPALAPNQGYHHSSWNVTHRTKRNDLDALRLFKKLRWWWKTVHIHNTSSFCFQQNLMHTQEAKESRFSEFHLCHPARLFYFQRASDRDGTWVVHRPRWICLHLRVWIYFFFCINFGFFKHCINGGMCHKRTTREITVH